MPSDALIRTRCQRPSSPRQRRPREEPPAKLHPSEGPSYCWLALTKSPKPQSLFTRGMLFMASPTASVRRHQAASVVVTVRV